MVFSNILTNNIAVVSNDRGILVSFMNRMQLLPSISFHQGRARQRDHSKSLKAFLWYFSSTCSALANVISDDAALMCSSVDCKNAKKGRGLSVGKYQRLVLVGMYLVLHQLLGDHLRRCWAKERILAKLVNERWRVATTF